MICAWCGRRYEPEHGPERDVRTCSDSCAGRLRLWEELHEDED